MAATHSAQPESFLRTQEALELLLDILPHTHQLTGLLHAENTKPTIRIRTFVNNFQAATYVLYENLGNLKNASAIENGAEVIHRATLCLEKIAGPKVVPKSLQKTLDLYMNLKAVRRLPNDAKKKFFYQKLKVAEVVLGRETLRILKRCVDDLDVLVTDTKEDLGSLPPGSEFANDIEDVCASIKNAYHALVACACEPHHTEEIHEMTLLLATEFKQNEFCSLNIFILETNSEFSNEVHILGAEKARSRPRVKFNDYESPQPPETKYSQKEIACSYSTWKENPDPAYFCANFVLAGNQLRKPEFTRRKFLSQDGSEKISLGDLIQSKSAGWPLVTKLILAVTLAHSLLHLNDGPWLNGYWSRSNIVFYQNESFALGRPFLRTKISSVTKVGSNLRSDYHQHPGILEFGIALLEIYFWKRIDEPATTMNSRWAIASKTLNQQQQYMQDGYRNAVNACLQPDFGIQTSVTPEQFRKNIFDKIVNPLKQELENGFKNIIEFNLLDEFASKIDLISGQFFDASEVQKPSTTTPLKSPSSSSSNRVSTSPSNPPSNSPHLRPTPPSNSPSTSSSNPLPDPTRSSFCLFEDENQPQDISKELCQQTDGWIRRFKKLVNSKLDELFIENNRITVAILDSGIDMKNTDIDAQSDRIKDIRSWVNGKAAVKAKTDRDLSGHGTHIAGILLDLAPNVDIYIARVTDTRELDNTDQIVKAFEYSWKTWNVDIITMSFGFQEDVPPLRKEINEAVHNGKIVFAAASNDGGNSGRAFPASQDRVICAHSTDSNGKGSCYNPSPKPKCDNFSILGQYINSCWPGANEAGESRRMTGTSFAVPVAAALAAFMIGYVQKEIPDLNEATELKSYEGIVSIFNLFVKCNGQRDGYDWIAPFEFFRRFGPVKIQEDIKDALTPH